MPMVSRGSWGCGGLGRWAVSIRALLDDFLDVEDDAIRRKFDDALRICGREGKGNRVIIEIK